MDRRLDPHSRWSRDRRTAAGSELASLLAEGRPVPAPELFASSVAGSADEVATWLAHAQASGLVGECDRSGGEGTGAYRLLGPPPAEWARRSDDAGYEVRWTRARQAAIALSKAIEEPVAEVPPPEEPAPAPAPSPAPAEQTSEAFDARFTTRTDEDEAVVRVVGSIDIASAFAFEQALLAALGDRIRTLTVDMRRTRHFDSTGVAVLVRVLRRCRNQGATFSVCVAPGGGVRTVLELAGMVGVVPIVDEC